MHLEIAIEVAQRPLLAVAATVGRVQEVRSGEGRADAHAEDAPTSARKVSI